MRIYKNELFNKNELIEEEVPNGWSVNKFENICSICRGASPRPINKFLTNSDGIPWIKIGDATKVSKYIKDTNEYITKEAAKKSRYVYDGDLIVSNSATPCLPRFVKKTSCIHDGWLLLRDFKGVDKEFLFYIFTIIKEKLKNQGNGSIFINLSTDILKNFYIKYPSIEEQKRIADVLSKQESIINKTKDLIEQLDKRNTFMQDELLSGRLRIKEEDGQVEFYKNPDDNWQTVLMNNIDYIIPLDWDILSLEHSDCSMGETILKSNILTDGEYPVYSATESDKIFGYINNPKKILEIGDLIISARGTIGYVKIAKQKCTSTQTTIQLKVNEITPIYLSTVLNNKRADFFPISGGAVPQITISQVKSIKISKPKQEKEIFNITNIIEKLNDEKEKYEELLIEEQKKFDFLLEELMSGRLRIEE